ncbi:MULTISPECIES: electron transport complex subunit RsxE [Prevotella]|jgi:electron transport complex protein RnfE|uniref:electron transport complex subunit RsxE n=1 Tax=Prevotella TaxID=838 RepID=UPI000D0E6BF1|nr:MULTISPECIES: electron transport complex subunit E [Prevotella]MEE0669009.1 electron transport complex subunit E [Prevotella sp.]
MNYIKTITNGIIKENPTFVLLLGMCPTLATTTSGINGMSMGLATMFVLICSNFVISLIKNVVPDMVRIPVFVVVIAAFVSTLQMLMEAYLPSINKSLGIYIPLIVVNCIILGRAEAFACKNNPLASICDGIGIGLGFTFALALLGAVRELIGAGTLFGIALLPETCNVLLFVLPPGAFITLGYLIAIVNKLRG